MSVIPSKRNGPSARQAVAREHDRVTDMSGPVLIFRTEPVEQADRDNLIAGCSGYFDRTSLALK
jgi:hypothetical protein